MCQAVGEHASVHVYVPVVGANPAPGSLALLVLASHSSVCTPCQIPASSGSIFGNASGT